MAKTASKFQVPANDGTVREFDNAMDAMQFMSDQRKALQAENEAARKANEALQAQIASQPAGRNRNDFVIKLSRYSEKPNPKTGVPHARAGQPKGTFEIFSKGSIYAITMAPDQWADIKAHAEDIEKFIEENRTTLKDMSAILAK
jgi:hypothetical protein